MEDPNKDYLTTYRSFFESLLKSVDLDYPLPVKIPNYNLTEQEISGEITTWCLQYLIERECPTSLASILCKRVLEEISRVEPELCGYRPQEQVYYPLQLMQETIRKLVEVCTMYTDNARLSELPPPPLSILYDPIVSMCGVKNSRRTMEDRHIAIQDLHTLFNVKNAVGPASYYAVFDGHNGCDAATYSNCHLHHYLVQSKYYPHNPEAALREAFATTDKLFIEKTAKGNLESGTTAVCALIRPEESMLYLAWLGDSQAVLVTKGVAYQLVKPHRPDQPEEMIRIKNMGGAVLFIGTWRVDGNLAVSRAIGDRLYKPYIVSEPDIRVVPLTGKEDYLILASDGLWDYLPEQMVVQAVDNYLVENKGAAGGVSKHLVQLAKKQCSRDNISCITVFLRDPTELIDNKDSNNTNISMEVQELDQQSSIVDQLWKRHQNEAVGGRHNGRMDEDDLGPETDVDSVEDVLLSPSIAAAKAAVTQAQANSSPVWPKERLQKEQQMWLKTLPWSYADAVRKNPPKKQLIQDDVMKDDNKMDEEKQEISPLPTASVEQHEEQQVEKDKQQTKEEEILQDPHIVVKDEIKNYVGDNDIDSGEESEEEWNYIPGKEKPKESLNQIQQIQQELNAEDEEDMESQLNPNAAEFVPVFIPPNSSAAILAILEKDVSSSPAKGAEQSLENIDVPTVNEFYSEISKRPSELESLNNDPNKSLNETTLNGVDITGISTKAVCGGDDSINFLSSVNSSTVANLGDDEDEAIEVALNDTNPFSPTHVPVPAQQNIEEPDTIQEQMVQDHFSLGFKPFDPMTQSITMMEDEGQHEDETSPDIDFMSSGKPDLLSPEVNQIPVGAAEALEAQTSSSGFDSESGPDDGDHIPSDQSNLPAADAAVGISFGEDIDLERIVNTKAMSMIDDSHPIEKIEQTISPSISPMPQPVAEEEVKEELVSIKEAEEEISKEVEKLLDSKDDIITTLKDEVTQMKNEEPVATVGLSEEPVFEAESVQITTSSFESHIEEKETIIEETLEKDVSPQQVVDLVQELQFNQEPSLITSKIKEEEPESDSGFEIINASEASNEPDVIGCEATNKVANNEEESSLVNGLVSNLVPDLLLQPSEPDAERQPSPIGIRTDNIIADIEGAMLDSSPPMIHNNVEESFVEVAEKIQEPLEVPIVDNEDTVTEKILQENKSPFSLELEPLENKPQLLDQAIEETKPPMSFEREDKMSFLIDQGLEENKTPTLVDFTLEETKPSLLIDRGLDEIKTSFLIDQDLNERKSPALFDEGLDNRKSPLLLDQEKDNREMDINKPSELVKEVKELVEPLSKVDESKVEIPEALDIKEMPQEIKEEFVVPSVTCLNFVPVEEKELESALGEIQEKVTEVIKVAEESTLIQEEINKQLKDHLKVESEELITVPSPLNEEVEVEVIKEMVQEKMGQQSIIVPDVNEKTQEIEESKEQVALVGSEQKEVGEVEIKEEVKKETPTIDEDKEGLPSQPTPPTTPAPGVTEEDNKQELIAAAIAAAGVAAGVGIVAKAASATETPKLDEKATPAVKKSTGSSAVSSKKPETSKIQAAKAASGTTRSPVPKPGASATPATKSPAAKKPIAVGSAAKPASKPASTAKAAAPSSKPSTPTTKAAPGSRPTSAKPSTPSSKTPVSSVQAKTPPKPRTPTTGKPLASTTTSTATTKLSGTSTTAKTTKTAPTTSAKPSSATAPKKPEPTAAKRSVPSTTAAKPATLASKTVAAPKTTSSSAAKPATKAVSATATKSPITKPAASTSTKTSATSANLPKAPAKSVGNTATTAKPTAAKTTVPKTSTAKPATANSTATKAPVPKTKPAAPTAIKKPLSADKNIKEATNNKLSAAKQPGPIKKQDMKTKQNDTKIIEPLTQEPTVTTTNGHIENGISNEESSPVEIAPFPQIVHALN